MEKFKKHILDSFCLESFCLLFTLSESKKIDHFFHGHPEPCSSNQDKIEIEIVQYDKKDKIELKIAEYDKKD